MVIVLTTVGIALLLFGALVVLKFPDKPGGTIKATVGGHGLQISSVGAGLPVIVIGAVLLVLAAFGPISGAPSAATPSSSLEVPVDARACPEQFLAGIPKDRVRTMETGTTGQPLVTADQPKSGAFGVVLRSAGQSIGAIRLEYFPDSRIFKVGAVVNAACGRTEDFSNALHPGSDKHVLRDWDILGFRIGGQSYTLRPGLAGTGAIEADFLHVTT